MQLNFNRDSQPISDEGLANVTGAIMPVLAQDSPAPDHVLLIAKLIMRVNEYRSAQPHNVSDVDAFQLTHDIISDSDLLAKAWGAFDDRREPIGYMFSPEQLTNYARRMMAFALRYAFRKAGG
jgi:hypothetical protein